MLSARGLEFHTIFFSFSGTSMQKLELKNVIPPNIVPKSTVDRILIVNGMMPVNLEHICADAK